jgi:hypothetical protein
MSGSSGPTFITPATIGQTVTFLSKNAADQVVWEGRVEGLVTSVIAQQYSDIVSYNAAVRLVDPTVSTDLTTLHFFVLTLQNNTGPVQRYAFAEEWIANGSFSVINQQAQVTVIVYDIPSSDHQQILTALRAAGYSCYIQSVSS